MTPATRWADVRTRATPRTWARSVALTVGGLRAKPGPPGLRIVHYHYVFDDQAGGFAAQLEELAAAYELVSLSEGVARLREERLVGRELAITFDDGFRNQLVNAAPLLADHGISACFYLVTELVGARESRVEWICREQLHLRRPVEPLGWDDVERLLEQGHEVGSHTRTHPNLAALSRDTLDAELQGSKAELEERIGRTVVHFSAPYGDRARFTPEVSAAARAAGYESCATAQRGRSTDPFALRRDHLVASWPVAHLRYFLSR